MEKIKLSEKETNEEILKLIGEERTLLNRILRRKANWIYHKLRINCLFHGATVAWKAEVKEVGRRRTQLLDYLQNSRRY